MSEGSLSDYYKEAMVTTYRTRISLETRGENHASTWKHIMEILQKWLCHNGSSDECPRPTLQELSKGHASGQNDQYEFTTRAFFNTEDDTIPMYWALEVLQRDNEYPERLWNTQVGITHGGKGFVFNIHVEYKDAVCMRDHAKTPAYRAPEFIGDLWEMDNVELYMGNSNLCVSCTDQQGHATVSGDNGGQDNISAVDTAEVIESQEETQTYSVFKDFSRRVAGLVNVQKILKPFATNGGSQENSDAFAGIDVLGEAEALEGGVCLYMPGFDPENPEDKQRRRVLTPGELTESSIEKLSREICVEMSTFYQRHEGEVVDIASVDAAARKKEAQRFHERCKHAHNESHELNALLALYDEEASQSEKSIAKLETSNILLNKKVNELYAKVEALDTEINSVRYDVYQANDARDAAEASKVQCKNSTQILMNLQYFPKTPLEALLFGEKVFGERLLVLPEAEKSAKKWGGSTDEIYQIMAAMYKHLWPLMFDKTVSADVEDEFANSTSFTVSLVETKATNQIADMKNARSVQYKGRTLDITPHIKGKSGKSGGKLRVHFTADQPTGKLIIGHCGAHLKTVGTRRRGL